MKNKNLEKNENLRSIYTLQLCTNVPIYSTVMFVYIFYDL